eukprot:4217355-Prorocentrum_lima.AAC.1
MEELLGVLRKFKKRRATGPDLVPMELSQLLPFEAKENLLIELNRWYQGADLPKGLTDAIV